MISPQFYNSVRKVCALVAATLILPSLAFAGSGNGQGGNQGGDSQGKSTVPDKGPGMALLITTIGAVLVYSSRQSSRSKA